MKILKQYIKEHTQKDGRIFYTAHILTFQWYLFIPWIETVYISSWTNDGNYHLTNSIMFCPTEFSTQLRAEKILCTTISQEIQFKTDKKNKKVVKIKKIITKC